MSWSDPGQDRLRTGRTALRLARSFGTTELFRINLQNRYDLEVDRRPYRRTMEPTYPRAVLASALQAVLTAVWVAADELPAPRRRLARAGSVLTLSALASVGDRGDPDDPVRARTAQEYGAEFSGRNLVLTAASVGVAVGLAVGRRQFEQRWLAALTRGGHPHPHRVLAVRMGLISFAGTAPGRLVRVYERRRAR